MNYIEYEKIMEECLEISKKKNADYGDDGFKKYKEIGILIRISDKISRLDNLLFNKQKEQVNDEKVEDTVKDAINYLIYLLIVHRGKLE